VTAEPTLGIALLCDDSGAIIEVMRDEFGLASRIGPGRTFSALVNAEGVGKALAFIQALRTHRAAFDWELNVPIDGRPETLHFAGAAVDDQRLLIVGARNRVDVEHFYSELLRINNEQATALRALMKEQSRRARERTAHDSAMYDDLMRLTNELGTLQRELAKKNAELEKLNEQKNQFLGMAAHDLRNPLGAITAFAGFLLDDAADRLTEEQHHFVEVIKTSSAFMLRLVNELLDIATIDAGKLHVDPRDCDLVALVRAHIDLNAHPAAKKGISLTCEAPPAPVIARVDPDRFDEILNNLVGNAIKFSPRDSHVEVRVAATTTDAVVAVRDDGPGIPADEVALLFAPFQRTSVSRTSGEPGAGLGLAIVQKIVTALGGRVTVDSRVGVGSTFAVSLPLAAARQHGGAEC